MVVVDDLSEKTINSKAEENLDKDVSAITDEWRGYSGLKKVIKKVKQTTYKRDYRHNNPGQHKMEIPLQPVS